MGIRKYFLFIFFQCTLILTGQSITIDLPNYAYIQSVISIHNGVNKDTVLTDHLDEHGKICFVFPDKLRNYRGIATLSINNNIFRNFILAGEDLTFSAKGDLSHGDDLIILNSPENKSYQKWYYKERLRQQKVNLLNELGYIYSKKDSFFFKINAEIKELENERNAYQDTLLNNSLYAAQMLRHGYFLDYHVDMLAFSNSLQMATVQTYIRNNLDINSLYTSGLWFTILNGISAMYDVKKPFHKEYAQDMILLLKRTSSDEIYNSLANAILEICQFSGWVEQENKLIQYLLDGRNIMQPKGKLKSLLSH